MHHWNQVQKLDRWCNLVLRGCPYWIRGDRLLLIPLEVRESFRSFISESLTLTNEVVRLLATRVCHGPRESRHIFLTLYSIMSEIFKSVVDIARCAADFLDDPYGLREFEAVMNSH